MGKLFDRALQEGACSRDEFTGTLSFQPGAIRIDCLAINVASKLDPFISRRVDRVGSMTYRFAYLGLLIWARLYCRGGEKAMLWGDPRNPEGWLDGLPNMYQSVSERNLFVEVGETPEADWELPEIESSNIETI